MGRRRKNSSKVTFMLDTELYDTIRTRLHDPFTQQMQNGAFSRLTTSLLRGWVRGTISVPNPLIDKGEPQLQEFIPNESDNTEESDG